MTAAFTFPRVIDATMRSDWLACPHRFFRRHIQGLTRDRANVHLHFGSCFATGLEVARKSYHCRAPFTVRIADRHVNYDPSPGDWSDAFHLASEAVIGAWGDFEPPPQVSRSEANKTLANCLLCLAEYFAEWPLDDDPMQVHFYHNEPCIEFSFALPVPGARHPDTGEPLLYAGRFDMIGEYQRSVWGLDDKTTSTDPNSDSWRNQWKLRSQFNGYAWGAREYGLPLRGFHVRGVAPRKESIRTGFAIVPRPDWMVDAWLRQLRDDVALMLDQYDCWIDGDKYVNGALGHPFPQVFDHACADFGGCSYLDLCSSQDPTPWEAEYVVRHWSPLDRTND